MALRGVLPVLCLAVLAVVRPGGGALADEAGCLVVGAWDEARGEPAPVIEAVVSTIVNRARSRGLSVCDAVMDPAALTGVTPAMHEVFSEAASPHGIVTTQPHTGHDRAQLAAVEAAAQAAVAGTLPDRSNGATHFYSPAGMRELGLAAAPRWAASMTETARVGPFVFLRERNLPAPQQARVAALPPETAAAPPTPQEPSEQPRTALPSSNDATMAALPLIAEPVALEPVPIAPVPIAPVPIAPLPQLALEPLPIRRIAPPMQMAAVVLDPGSYLDIRKAGTGPHFSFVPEAAAAELPAQGAQRAPTDQTDAPAAASEPTSVPESSSKPEPNAEQQATAALVSALPPAPTPTERMPHAPTPLLAPAPVPPRAVEAQNDWAQPGPSRDWARPDRPHNFASIQPVAEYVPPPPRLPAVGYFSPEAGTWLYCRGWGTRAVAVQVRWRRLWRPALSGVRCGM